MQLALLSARCAVSTCRLKSPVRGAADPASTSARPPPQTSGAELRPRRRWFPSGQGNAKPSGRPGRVMFRASRSTAATLFRRNGVVTPCFACASSQGVLGPVRVCGTVVKRVFQSPHPDDAAEDRNGCGCGARGHRERTRWPVGRSDRPPTLRVVWPDRRRRRASTLWVGSVWGRLLDGPTVDELVVAPECRTPSSPTNRGSSLIWYKSARIGEVASPGVEPLSGERLGTYR